MHYLILLLLVTYSLTYGGEDGFEFAARLCKDSSTDLYIKECMDHCTTNHDTNSCGMCANHGTLQDPIQKRCICFKGLTCALASPTR